MTASPRSHRSIPQRLKAGDGMTLVELLVAMALLLVVTAAIFSFLQSASRLGNSDLERNESLNTATVKFAQMVNEIRQAYQVNCPVAGCSNAASSSYIDFDERITTSAQQDARVAFVCDVPQPGSATLHECVRYQAAASDVSDPVPLGTNCLPPSCTSSVVVQNVVNTPVNTPVFTNLTGATGPSGTTRWISGKATVYTPGGGSSSSQATPYRSDVVLSQWFSMPQLGFGQ